MDQTAPSTRPVARVPAASPRRISFFLPPVPRQVLWQGKFGPAFWTLASLVSLTINLILILILIGVGKELFSIKKLVSEQLVGGLYNNFVQMDSAHIVTTINVRDTIQVQDTIQVKDAIPVVFDLPLQQATEVKLTQDTPVNGATIFLNEQPVPLDLILRRGTKLNIALDLVVPVSQTVPVVLNVPVNLQVPVDMQVPVDIALNKTDLHQPFVGLQNVVAPYHQLLASPPHSWREALCGKKDEWMCAWLFSASEWLFEAAAQ